jgi:hypothetical protein
MLRQHLHEQSCQFLTKLVNLPPSITDVVVLHNESCGLYSACHPHELGRHYIIIIIIIIIVVVVVIKVKVKLTLELAKKVEKGRRK